MFLAHRMISSHTRANALYTIGDITLSKKNTWNQEEKETQVKKFTKIILYYYQTNYLEMATKSPILDHSFGIDI